MQTHSTSIDKLIITSMAFLYNLIFPNLEFVLKILKTRCVEKPSNQKKILKIIQ